MSRAIDIDQLRSFFEDRSNCNLVYLFGSASDGRVREGSDLDLAILFEEKPDIMELAGLRADLCGGKTGGFLLFGPEGT